MANVNVTITEVIDQTFPAGTVAGDFAYDLMQNGTSVLHMESPDLTVTFLDVPTGDYTAQAQRMDVNRNRIGQVATSATFHVPSGPVDVTVSVPNAVSVLVTP